MFALAVGAANGAAAASQLWITPPSEAIVTVKSGGITVVATDVASLNDKFAALNYSLRRGSRRARLGAAPTSDQPAQGPCPRQLGDPAQAPVHPVGAATDPSGQRRDPGAAPPTGRGRRSRGRGARRERRRSQWLETLAEDYGVTVDDIGALTRRVDIVPPSLAIAQAAEETGWGTSRFALEGNALFGQRTFNKGAGPRAAPARPRQVPRGPGL